MNQHTDVSARRGPFEVGALELGAFELGALELGRAAPDDSAPNDSAMERQLAVPGGTIALVNYCPPRIDDGADTDGALEAAALTDPGPRPTPAMPISPLCRRIDDAALEQAGLEMQPKPMTIVYPGMRGCK